MPSKYTIPILFILIVSFKAVPVNAILMKFHAFESTAERESRIEG